MMSRTPKQRTEIAKALQAAKRHLNTGRPGDCRTSHICFAIQMAEVSGEISGQLSQAASRVISNRLEGHAGAWSWLHNVAGVPDTEITHPAVQAWRHAWLNQLIEEFES